MTNKLSRRKFLLTSAHALLGGWLSRLWEPEPSLPPQASEDGYTVAWDKARPSGEYTSTLAEAFDVPEGSCLYIDKLPDHFEERYLDAIRQKEPIACWPSILPSASWEWELEGDPVRAKRVESILRRIEREAPGVWLV